MQEEKETQKESLINPITNEKVDESISETEAKARGYLELEFLMKHLEDENEYIKFFIIGNKKVIVHLKNPMTKYKKSPQLNHERILQETEKKEKANQLPAVSSAVTCSLDDQEGCISCSG